MDESTDNSNGEKPQEQLNQESYRPTQYQDSTYEIVGEELESEDFEPLELAVVDGQLFSIDPMFADYGGVPEGNVKRWHLPEGKAFVPPNANSSAAEPELEENSIKMSKDELERIKIEVAEATRKEALLEAEKEREKSQHAQMESFKTIISDMLTQYKELLEQFEKQSVELCMLVAKRIINHAVEINPDYITEIIRAALDQAGMSAIKKIKVSPQDLEFIEVLKVSDQFKEFDGSWQFEADETVNAGCIVETSAGEIDFDLDAAWERVKNEVLKVVP